MPRVDGEDGMLQAAPLFAALGDATRLTLLSRLCDGGPASIARLTQATTITRQGVSKHLRALEAAGLVHAARAGRERIWQVRPERLSDARRYLDQISRDWDAAIERLRKFVEGA